MSFTQLHKTTALIFKKNQFVGSGVFFPWKNELLCVTAGHNLYGKAFNQTPTLQEWLISDDSGETYPIKEICGDVAFATEHDLIVLKLKHLGNLDNFCYIKFCTIPKNPKYSHLFRGKYESASQAVTHRNIAFNAISTSSNKFTCAIDKTLLTNDTFKSGSDWLGGWSGSGLFIDNHHELICTGVMIEIPNRGNDGQLLFASVSAIKNLGIGLEILQATELDFNHALSQSSLNAIISMTNEEAVIRWENDTIHKPQLQFINEKLSKVYPQTNFQENKQRVIKQLIIGKSYLTAELKKNEHLFSQYETAYKVFNLEDKLFYVNSKSEAKEVLSKIKEDYEKYLCDCLGKTFSTPDIKLLAFYGVSEWIANCSLNFLPNE